MQQRETPPRQSERKWKPIVRPGYVSYMASEESTDDPTTVEEAMACPEREDWTRAMQKEIHSLQKNNTWDKVGRPPGVKPLTVKWVYKRKITESGKTRYKARLVAKGCTQIEGRDYDEIFSPVISGKLKKLKKFLNKFFEIKDLGEVKHFLGLEIHQNKAKGEIKITQQKYIEWTLKKFRMEDCKPIGTSADLNVKLTGSNERHDETSDDDFRTQYLEAI
ncbi:integrase core, partial [Lasius niger]